jgi:hypothetical protein
VQEQLQFCVFIAVQWPPGWAGGGKPEEALVAGEGGSQCSTPAHEVSGGEQEVPVTNVAVGGVCTAGGLLVGEPAAVPVYRHRVQQTLARQQQSVWKHHLASTCCQHGARLQHLAVPLVELQLLHLAENSRCHVQAADHMYAVCHTSCAKVHLPRCTSWAGCSIRCEGVWLTACAAAPSCVGVPI